MGIAGETETRATLLASTNFAPTTIGRELRIITESPSRNVLVSVAPIEASAGHPKDHRRGQ